MIYYYVEREMNNNNILKIVLKKCEFRLRMKRWVSINLKSNSEKYIKFKFI